MGISLQRLLRNFIGNYFALSQGENNAIAGTSGTPSSTNKFLTNADSRNTDAREPTAHYQAFSTITETPTTASGYGITDVELVANKGVNNGYASLGSTGLVSVAQLGTGASTTMFLRGDQTWQAIAGGGDMTKAVYDPGNIGTIAEAQLTLSFATHSNTNDHIDTAATQISTHRALTASIHNFDASGNAPPQAHSSTAHSTNFATLDVGSLVIQNPTNATSTPAAAKIPLSGAGISTLDAGWIPSLATTYQVVAFATAVVSASTAGLSSAVGTSTSYCHGDHTHGSPAAGGGSDPWTYLVRATDFTTTSASAVDVTTLGFAPAANTKYEFESLLMIRTATATVNPRVGLAWPSTGMTDGVAMIEETQAAATVPIVANGNINAALLIAVGGIPTISTSWPVRIQGMVIAGATPAGNLRIQLASETAGTIVRIVAGSFLKYRSYA